MPLSKKAALKTFWSVPFAPAADAEDPSADHEDRPYPCCCGDLLDPLSIDEIERFFLGYCLIEVRRDEFTFVCVAEVCDESKYPPPHHNVRGLASHARMFVRRTPFCLLRRSLGIAYHVVCHDDGSDSRSVRVYLIFYVEPVSFSIDDGSLPSFLRSDSPGSR